MKNTVRVFGLFLAPCLLATAPAAADGIVQAKSPPLRLVYFDPFGKHLLDYTTESFQLGLAAQEKLFGYQPEDEVVVLLRDFADRGNATTVLGAPRNRVFVDIAPPQLSFETFSPGPAMPTLANHELVHVATADRAASRDRLFRKLFFGKVAPVTEHPESILYYYLTNPRASTPRWYMEGSATFIETWMAGGLGRAQGGYDEMVFRSMAKDQADFFDPLALASKGSDVDFQAGANAYLYGTRFISYLVELHGPERLLEWLTRDDDSLAYYAHDFQRVYGISLEQAWSDWVAWERAFQADNLARVRQFPPTEGRDLAREGLGAMSRAYLTPSGREMLAAVRYPGRVPSIVALDLESAEVRELAEVTGAIPNRVTSLAYDPEGGILYYTVDNGNFRTLMSLDLNGGSPRQLLKSARIGDLAFDRSDGSLWGLRYNNGFVMLVNLPAPFTEWKQVHVFPYGESAFDLDVSPDGSLLSVSVAGPDPAGGAQRMVVRVLNREALLAGDATPLREFDSGVAVPESFVFSEDGRYLFGSSFYTGVSNIFRFEIETGDIQAMSNAEVGLFRPVPVGGDRLLAFRYTAQGFIPTEIPRRTYEDVSAIEFLGARLIEKHPILGDWQVELPTLRSTNPVPETLEPYRPLSELALEAVYPSIEGYKGELAGGLHARFSDPVGFDYALISASFSPGQDLPSDERLHLQGQLRHGMWKLTGKYNAGDFYDLFGPTERAREGYSLRVDYERPMVYEPPRTVYLLGHLAHYGGLDALPDFQNVPSPEELTTAGLEMTSRHPRRSVGAVDDEKGYLWSVAGQGSHAEGDWTFGLTGRLDLGTQLPWRHASIWWRNAAGVRSGDRENPLANLYLGGFGNNYVDNGDVKRYRDLLSMPGFELNALGGQSFVKSMLELNLPPLRFEALGSPGLYPSWLRTALFASALALDPTEARYRTTAGNVGLQVDIQWSVLHRLPMTLSAGVARGFGGNGAGETEWMLSLKVL